MTPLLPLNPGNPSALAPQPRDWDVLLTAETHNFPCAVAPYPGQPSVGWVLAGRLRPHGRHASQILLRGLSDVQPSGRKGRLEEEVKVQCLGLVGNFAD